MAGCEDSLYVGYTVVTNALEMLKAESRAENYFLSSCVYEIVILAVMRSWTLGPR